MTLLQKGMLGVIVALCAYIGVLQWRNIILRREIHTVALERNNAIARADTTRIVFIKALGDLWRAAERQAVQQHMKRDQIDKELHRESRLRVQAQVRLDSLLRQADTGSVVRDSADIRMGSFHVDPPPFTIDITAKFPPPPQPGLWDVAVRVEPIRLNIRAQCSMKDRNGVRVASVLVTGPVWAMKGIVVDSAEQSPEVCMPERPSTKKRDIGVGLLLGVLGGFLLFH